MGYNARNDEIRDNVTRMQASGKRNAVSWQPSPFQRTAFRQRLCLVLAHDCRRSHVKTSLVNYRRSALSRWLKASH
jgi:hypothetical protein